MRILLVSPTFPYPPSWGFGIRVYQLARHLAQRHRVTLLTYARPDEMVQVEALEQVVGDVRAIVHPQCRGLVKRLRQVASFLSPEPYQVKDLHTAEMQRAINTVLAMEQFDVVQLESSHLSSFDYGDAGVLVLDEHNIEYELLQRLREGERSRARRLYNNLECRKLLPLEHRSWRKVDGCVLTSEREEAIVRFHAPTTRVTTVPNGVDPEYFTPTGATVRRESLLFTGLLSYRPNFDAATYLVKDILPLLRDVRPTVMVTIVGYGTDGELDSLRRDGVSVTGPVPDVRPYLEKAAVVVVPIRMGGGTRLKVIEALAMAKGVVSTSIGCEGLNVLDGEHLLIADSAADFASKVARLLADSAEADRLGRAGRRLMVSDYSWSRSTERLEALYRSLL